ncbi:MAG: nitroreductase family protein [Anaerolineae bacterium]|nr:nitroreductase family protein [Anaerolineae bacterium]
MLQQGDLYQAILARRSVRRYEKRPLDETTLAQMREIISSVKPLIPENRFEVLVRDEVVGEDLVTVLGGYGRFYTPPHSLAPYILGKEHVLEDLGYRSEQIAVRLAALGIGSCYIGALKREDKVRVHFGLPKGARIAAFLVFGRPATAVGGRTFNTLMRRGLGGHKRLSVERIFFQDTFDNPAAPPAEISPLIEVARVAPSGVNAQPWRFLWRDGRLYLFVTRNNPKYTRAGSQEYGLHDSGICMANVTLALEALRMVGRWVMFEGTEPDIPAHPADLHPLATLVMRGEQ